MASNENHKSARFCRVVADTLSLALSECVDDALLDLSIRDVEPSPSPGRLLVTVETSWPTPDPATIMAALARVHGRLRSDVARAIRRKRAPELVFRVALPDSAG